MTIGQERRDEALQRVVLPVDNQYWACLTHAYRWVLAQPEGMRVAMYYNNKDVRLEEMPKPKIEEEELLVKVIASGICGSDVMEWYRIKRAPLVLGHEIAGDIVEAGSRVRRFRVGQRVFVSHHVPCMKCRYCLSGHESTCDTLRKTNFFPGGFAEYLRVPEMNIEKGVYVLPKELTYEEDRSLNRSHASSEDFGR